MLVVYVGVFVPVDARGPPKNENKATNANMKIAKYENKLISVVFF